MLVSLFVFISAPTTIDSHPVIMLLIRNALSVGDLNKERSKCCVRERTAASWQQKGARSKALMHWQLDKHQTEL